MLGTSVPAVQAHDGGWHAAGAVLTGVGAGLLIAQAVNPPPPVYVSPAPVVVPQPAPVVVQQPAPVQQVVVQQPTVVYQQAPVVYAPAPVVYAAPVYVRPVAPVVSFRFGFGGPYYHHHHW
jgi:hypothetical protein